MDRKQLNLKLQALLSAQRLARYQGIVVTVGSEGDFEQICTQIEAICLDHDLWRQPGADGAPKIPCPRRAFMDSVFQPRPHALAILNPDDWMTHWPAPEQATFWNAVADAYGRHEILIPIVATPPIRAQLRISFVEYSLSGLPVSVWLSRHQPVDHLKEVLA